MKKQYFEIHKYAFNIFNQNIKELLEKYKDENRKCIMFGTSIIAEMIVDKLKDTVLDI